MKAFVCDDKNGEKLYVGDEVKVKIFDANKVGIMMSNPLHPNRMYNVKMNPNDIGFVTVYEHELEKVKKEIVMKKELKKFNLATAKVGDKLINSGGDCIFVGITPYARKGDEINIIIKTSDEKMLYTSEIF